MTKGGRIGLVDRLFSSGTAGECYSREEGRVSRLNGKWKMRARRIE